MFGKLRLLIEKMSYDPPIEFRIRFYQKIVGFYNLKIQKYINLFLVFGLFICSYLTITSSINFITNNIRCVLINDGILTPLDLIEYMFFCMHPMFWFFVDILVIFSSYWMTISSRNNLKRYIKILKELKNSQKLN